MRNLLVSILILLITFSADAYDIGSKPSYIDGSSPELSKLEVRGPHEIGIRYIGSFTSDRGTNSWSPEADSDIPENKVFIPADTSAVRYIGRTSISDGTVSFDWSGTKIATVVKNTGTFAVSAHCKGESYFNVFIDGIQYDTIRISGDTLITVTQDLDKETHEIVLQKRSEGEFGKMTVNGFVLDKHGQIKAPEKKKRLIEFIGDSITCGYGTEGNDREDPFLVSTENSGLSYASLIADYFNADCTLIAHSGRGAARNYGDSLTVSDITMKDLMLRTLDSDSTSRWDFSRYRPDIVVINLGTNDFSTKPHPSAEEFENAYKKIISQLREHYGNIPIMCVGPRVGEPALTYIKAICQSANDENLYFGGSLAGVYNNTSDLGAAWHPGITGQQKIAMTLIPRISTITGWPLSDWIH